MRGGYQILNLKNEPLTSGSKKVIDGSFNQLDRSNKKRVVISNMTIAGNPPTDKPDFESVFIKSDGVYRSTFAGGSLAVSNDDGVTYTAE